MVAYAKSKQTNPRLTPQEYLERERKAETKSEYHDGVIVAMAGASREHNCITFDISRHLGNQLNDGSCEGFANDMRVGVPKCNRYFYPDVVVGCGELEFEETSTDTLLNPTLIIEVLSETTEKADREEKFDCYWTLASLKTYVLVAQDQPRLEIYNRQADGSWRLEIIKGLEATATLNAIGCTLKLADIYRRIPFAQTSSQSVEETQAAS